MLYEGLNGIIVNLFFNLSPYIGAIAKRTRRTTTHYLPQTTKKRDVVNPGNKYDLRLTGLTRRVNPKIVMLKPSDNVYSVVVTHPAKKLTITVDRLHL